MLINNRYFFYFLNYDNFYLTTLIDKSMTKTERGGIKKHETKGEELSCINRDLT